MLQNDFWHAPLVFLESLLPTKTIKTWFYRCLARFWGWNTVLSEPIFFKGLRYVLPPPPQFFALFSTELTGEFFLFKMTQRSEFLIFFYEIWTQSF